MGIEDLNLDLDEHAERILVVAPSDSAAERIGKLLQARNYAWQSAPDVETAGALAEGEVFDMIVAEFPDAALPPIDAITAVLANPNLRRSPLLVLHPAADSVSREYLDGLKSPVQTLKSPWEPPALLVKVSSQLRMLKIRSEEAGFGSKVVSQNAELRDMTNRFKHELLEAQNIQNSILPTSLPTAENTLFAATYVPLEAVGGDLYDLWKIEKDLFGLFIGDVTGHGISAAFIGAMTKMAQTYAPKTGPEAMLEDMNKGIVPLMPDGRFVTVAAAFYRPSNGELLVARGGHPPGLLYRAADQTVTEISPRGFPLGVMDMARYELFKTVLAPGDKFLFVTDGLTEAINMDGKDWGVKGVAEAFRQLAMVQPIDECIISMLEKQMEFTSGRIVKDDITLVGIERK